MAELGAVAKRNDIGGRKVETRSRWRPYCVETLGNARSRSDGDHVVMRSPRT